MTKIFYDLETTGTDFRKHSIHQLAFIVEVDGEVAETVEICTAPHPKAQIDPKALRTSRVTEEQIRAYQPMEQAYGQFLQLLRKYVDPYDKRTRAHLVGFNNRHFGDPFLEAWMRQNGCQTPQVWFWTDTIDVLVLASQYLLDRRDTMQSFRLRRVALTLGLDVEDEDLHDATYDVELTRQIYRIVTGLEMEL